MIRTTLEDFEQAGIAALVRAGEAKDWFSGHFGAMMISGARLLRKPNLPGAAGIALTEKLRNLCEQHRDRYAPLEKPGAVTGRFDPLLDALHSGAGCLRTSGHSTIYIATALSVLRREPCLATSRVIDGLLLLHEAGLHDDPGRYYGVPDYFAVTDRESNQASVGRGDSIEAFRTAVASLDHLVADQQIEGRHYFLTGEKIHLLTHAHAVATLEALEYAEIAGRAMEAQGCLARLIEPSRALAASEIETTECTPFDAAFWEQEFADPAHVIKLAEAVVAEVPRLPETERRIALERMRGVWALLGIR